MKIFESFKSSIGKRMLSKEIEPVRLRQGFNFHSAQRVAFLYIDSDEDFLKKIKQYASFLKDNYGIKSVSMMGFVNRSNKQIPAYQQHILESDFFTPRDLNWYMRPVNRVSNFTLETFDIVIDFSGGESVPINFVLKESKAHMKVGLKGSAAEKYCDFIIDMSNQFGIAKYVEQLNLYLSNPNIK